MVRDHHTDIVQLNQYVYAIQQFMYLTVVVLLTIKEVDDGVNHNDVWFMKGDLIRERLDICITHQVLTQPPTDNQVVIANPLHLWVSCKAPVVHLNTPLQELCNDLCLKPHYLQGATERHLHEVCTRCRTCSKRPKPIRFTDLGFAQQQHSTLLKDESITPVLINGAGLQVSPFIVAERLETQRT